MNRTIRKWVMMGLITLLFLVLNIDVQAAEGQVRLVLVNTQQSKGKPFQSGCM